MQPWRVIDLACGGGEASTALATWWDERGIAHGKRKRTSLDIEACDPYAGIRELYARQTGRVAEPWSFADVANGVLETRRSYDLVLASFCLHLLEGSSELQATLRALARRSRLLCVAAPHKKPIIDAVATGWRRVGQEVVLADETDEGSTRHRVRVRLYQSSLVDV